LVTKHIGHTTLGVPRGCRWPDYASDVSGRKQFREWLKGLDWLLFAETPWFDELPHLARELGVRVACIPMWERTCIAHSGWLRHVDLMLCPTRHATALFQSWRQRFGFTWQLAEVPWPIDVRRFKFQQRTRCERFLFVNGHGGLPGRKQDGTVTPYHRKGAEIIAQASRLVPDIPITVISQKDSLPSFSTNVQILTCTDDLGHLYQHGDVCIQPSHWEGIGLQLLECQAAGMPLVTTDAAPMTEFQPLATFPVCGEDVVSVFGSQPVAAQRLDAGALADTLRGLHGRDIRRASLQARSFVRRHHNWKFARRLIRQAFAGAPRAIQPTA
jgi:glycosyltransferase involved in cell wall biosynthesis